MRVENNPGAQIPIVTAAVMCLTVTACSEKAVTPQTSAAKTDTPSPEAAAKVAADEAREEEATKIGVEAVVYGLPLIMVDLTKRVYTNTDTPEPNGHAPLNQFEIGRA